MSYHNFVNHCPLLFYAVFALCGAYISFFQLLAPFTTGIISLLIIFILHLLYRNNAQRLILGIVCCCLSTFIPYIYYDMSLPQKMEGDCWVQIDNIQTKQVRFQKVFFIRGCVLGFKNNSVWKKSHFYIHAKLKEKNGWFLKEKGRYLVSGEFQKSRFNTYLLTPKKDSCWLEQSSPSQTHIYKKNLQKSIVDWMALYFYHQESKALLQGMVTGFHDNPELNAQLQYLGLSHLIAISGFHFSLLALFCLTCLRPILPSKVLIPFVTLIFIMYGEFVSFSPSVLRAFMMSCFPLWSYFSHRSTQALNLLGAAALTVLFLHPLDLLSLGFQFSFLVTTAILILYPRIRSFLLIAIPETTPSQNFFYKKMRTFVREGLSLNLAVTVPSLPLSWLHFEQFPLLSLIYNFFIPMFLGFSLMFFLTAVLLLPLSVYLSEKLLSLCHLWTTFSLSLMKPSETIKNMIFAPPQSVSISLLILGFIWMGYEAIQKYTPKASSNLFD